MQSVEMPVMGIPVQLESNVPEVLDCARDAFAIWTKLGPSLGDASPSAVKVMIVLDKESRGQRAVASDVRWHLPTPERLVLSGSEVDGYADLRARNAEVRISVAALRDGDHFRYSVLEAVTLFLVTALDRTPLHASAIMQGHTALLLAGPSGVGKSTLCYAAYRAGFDVLSDDAVYVQRLPQLCVWGRPGRLHLAPASRAHFPELRDREPKRQPNGKQKISLNLEEDGRLPEMANAKRAGVCFLTRDRKGPPVRRVSPDTVGTLFKRSLEPGFDLFSDRVEATAGAVAERGAWELVVQGNPTDLVDRLTAVFGYLGSNFSRG